MPLFKFLLLLLVLGTFAACNTIPDLDPDFQQSVKITSHPSGAEVFVEGSRAGVTPLELELDRTVPHAVTVRKRFFEQATDSFTPSYVDMERPFFRFGFVDYDADRTYLVPENLHFNLRTTLVPRERPQNGFDSLQQLLDNLDTILRNEEISEEDHRVIGLQILNFFAN